MIIMNLQLFAHKKGMGSSRNGRDSHAQRLGKTRKKVSVYPKAEVAAE